MPVFSEGLQTGVPLAANTLLAEYQNTSGGAQGPAPLVVLTGSVLSVMELQRRNAANNANIWAHRFWVSATDPAQLAAPSAGFALEDGERLRVILVTGILGSCQASLFM